MIWRIVIVIGMTISSVAIIIYILKQAERSVMMDNKNNKAPNKDNKKLKH